MSNADSGHADNVAVASDDVDLAMPPVCFILVEPTHPGNIGGVARAMKTMGFDRLRLVNPRRFPSEEATAMAVGADDVLKQASLVSSFAEAVADCELVIGTSARVRRIHWPDLPPAVAAAKLAEFEGRGQVAVVFGRESSGLNNQELDLCHYLVRIPCNPEFRSLNLSSAVQVIAYEIRKHALASGTPAVSDERMSGRDPDAPAAQQEVGRFYAHLESALRQTRFFSGRQPTSLMRRLRRLFNRAHPSQREINILRGVLSAFERARKADEIEGD